MKIVINPSKTCTRGMFKGVLIKEKLKELKINRLMRGNYRWDHMLLIPFNKSIKTHGANSSLK